MRVVQTQNKITYRDTLRKKYFPWNELKFGKFTPQDCYAKYTKIVPDEESFKEHVLHLGRKRIEKESKSNIKILSALKKKKVEEPIQVVPIPIVEEGKYCICKSSAVYNTYFIGKLFYRKDILYKNNTLKNRV